jgi:hypothetical protein
VHLKSEYRLYFFPNPKTRFDAKNVSASEHNITPYCPAVIHQNLDDTSPRNGNISSTVCMPSEQHNDASFILKKVRNRCKFILPPTRSSGGFVIRSNAPRPFLASGPTSCRQIKEPFRNLCPQNRYSHVTAVFLTRIIRTAMYTVSQILLVSNKPSAVPPLPPTLITYTLR